MNKTLSQTSIPETTPALHNSNFMKACRREETSYTPIWIMRQAGRFMKEYRDIRAKVGFLELCKNSDLASEVTVMAVEKLGVDAAIIFADILLPLEPMGAGLEYAKGDGPVIHNPVRSASDVDNLKPISVSQSLDFVGEAIKKTRRALPANVPLIGFAGAPFTLASYLIEGGGSRHFEQTKRFMYCESQAWHKLMKTIVATTVEYLNFQVASGAQVVQLFDSWIGCLGQEDYRLYVQPHMKDLFAGINKNVPAIHFGTGTPSLLELMRDAGGDVIGIDWRIDLAEGWKRIGYDRAVQGNLDPVILLSDKEQIRRRAKQILDQAESRPGHIFNLGHGVLPPTQVENVQYLVEYVHEISAR